MRQPAVYTPYEMQNWTTSEEFAPGIYRSARPLNFMWSFSRSLYVAWQVFLGRWDALNWNSTQGYERKSYPSDQEKWPTRDGWQPFYEIIKRHVEPPCSGCGAAVGANHNYDCPEAQD